MTIIKVSILKLRLASNRARFSRSPAWLLLSHLRLNWRAVYTTYIKYYPLGKHADRGLTFLDAILFLVIPQKLSVNGDIAIRITLRNIRTCARRPW